MGDDAEKILGRKFKNRQLLRQALKPGGDHQRLEFLGDRVLGLLAAASLFNAHKGEREGELSLRFYRLTDTEILLKIAAENNLTAAGFIAKKSAADMLEALLAAVYLDGGIVAAEEVFQRLWGKYLLAPLPSRPSKSALQEWAQQRELGLPNYETVAAEGADHLKQFAIKVSVGGRSAVGRGESKAIAGTRAAAELLKSLENE